MPNTPQATLAASTVTRLSETVVAAPVVILGHELIVTLQPHFVESWTVRDSTLGEKTRIPETMR